LGCITSRAAHTCTCAHSRVRSRGECHVSVTPCMRATRPGQGPKALGPYIPLLLTRDHTREHGVTIPYMDMYMQHLHATLFGVLHHRNVGGRGKRKLRLPGLRALALRCHRVARWRQLAYTTARPARTVGGRGTPRTTCQDGHPPHTCSTHPPHTCTTPAPPAPHLASQGRSVFQDVKDAVERLHEKVASCARLETEASQAKVVQPMLHAITPAGLGR